jgi:hypothetical protein
MIRWENRPIEVANLLNPAFCGEVLFRAISECQATSRQPFPYALTFLVLPIVLHKRTREQIPIPARVQLHAWLQQHQDVRVGFAGRTKQMVPITYESMLFLLQLNQLSIDEQGHLIARIRRRPPQLQTSLEIEDCYRKARIVGRWFARAGASENVFTMWGVKP